ncbi:hypothetical protein BAUCODRAFT_20713 [Baudoinia panamericana UAMH 10762]|uniref:Uncharacterized protein n=1 Tax=Baudoinia panamericana (strain UAMH 10762) TaxID=717646 RepID=M2MUP2_BAUPA|nr:uncharacterized protein BAUCODRAFT_20713 [Baudoinia panamericana UAMH 10762]EMD00652.1 hypothetical protein BAUCODRAFT_20713 [Baudoinia panamericana UAMH 10762]
MKTSPERVQGIIIRPLAPGNHSSSHEGIVCLSGDRAQSLVDQVPRNAVPACGWYECSLSAKLGIPLKLGLGVLDTEHSGPNYAAQLLTMQSDPSEVDFGRSVTGLLFGDIILARTSGNQGLSLKNVRRLLEYVHFGLMEMKLMGINDELSRAARAEGARVIAGKITAKSMKEFRKQPEESGPSAVATARTK